MKIAVFDEVDGYPKSEPIDNERMLALLKKLNACDGALSWLGDEEAAQARGEEPGQKRSAQEAWADSGRPDFMLWAVVMVGVDRKLVVLTDCAIARESLKHVTPGAEARDPGR